VFDVVYGISRSGCRVAHHGRGQHLFNKGAVTETDSLLELLGSLGMFSGAGY